MVLPSTGPISFANLQTEFGGNNPISMHEYYARSYTKPTVVGVAHTTLNTGASATITLPAGTQSGDKVYLHIVYEASTASRPTITDFTIETSFNGTRGNTDLTQVFASATIPLSTGSTITIPNTTPVNFGGLAASIIVVRGVYTYNATPFLSSVDVGAIIPVTKSDVPVDLSGTVSINPDEILITMAGYDGASETLSSWTSTGFNNTYNYLSGDGAVTARACQVNTRTVTGQAECNLKQPTGGTGTYAFVSFTLRGALTLPIPNNNNLSIPSFQNLPNSNSQVSISTFRGTQSVSITPIDSFLAGADSSRSISLTPFAEKKYVWIVIGVNMASSGVIQDTDRSWSIKYYDNTGMPLAGTTNKLFDSHAFTDSDGHRTAYLSRYIGSPQTGYTTSISWVNGVGGIPNREQHITVYAITGVPELTVFNTNRLVGSTGDGSVTAYGNGRCITILQATTNDGNAPTAISNATLGGVSSRHASYYNTTDASSTIHTTSGLPANGFGQFVAVSFAY